MTIRSPGPFIDTVKGPGSGENDHSAELHDPHAYTATDPRNPNDTYDPSFDIEVDAIVPFVGPKISKTLVDPSYAATYPIPPTVVRDPSCDIDVDPPKSGTVEFTNVRNNVQFDGPKRSYTYAIPTYGAPTIAVVPSALNDADTPNPDDGLGSAIFVIVVDPSSTIVTPPTNNDPTNTVDPFAFIDTDIPNPPHCVVPDRRTRSVHIPPGPRSKIQTDPFESRSKGPPNATVFPDHVKAVEAPCSFDP